LHHARVVDNFSCYTLTNIYLVSLGGCQSSGDLTDFVLDSNLDKIRLLPFRFRESAFTESRLKIPEASCMVKNVDSRRTDPSPGHQIWNDGSNGPF
jgi:hypothetical protein